MSAQDNLSPQQFYHGTQACLSPGDVIQPASVLGKDVNFPGLSSPEHAYVATDRRDARWYGRHGGSYPDANVYSVEPINPNDVEPDPNEWSSNDVHHEFRSRSGLKVTS